MFQAPVFLKNDNSPLFKLSQDKLKQMLNEFKTSHTFETTPNKLDMYFQVIDGKLYKVVDGNYIEYNNDEQNKKEEPKIIYDEKEPLNNEPLKDEININLLKIDDNEINKYLEMNQAPAPVDSFNKVSSNNSARRE